MDKDRDGKIAMPWSVLCTTRHLLGWLRDLVWPSFNCVLLQCGTVDISTRNEHSGGNAGVYARVRVTNRRAKPGAVQTVQVYEKRTKAWKIEALILFPDREEATLPLALPPTQACEVGLRARSPSGVPVRTRRRTTRLTLRLQDHRGRCYHLALNRKRMRVPQASSQPTPSV